MFINFILYWEESLRGLLDIIEEIFGDRFLEKDHIEVLSKDYDIICVENVRKQNLYFIETDIVLRINEKFVYHLAFKFQRKRDTKIQMYEYDTQVLADFVYPREKRKNELRYPKSAVVFLNCDINDSDVESLKIRMSDGIIIEYTIQVMKIPNYTLDMIHSKRLYILLPLVMVQFHNGLTGKEEIESFIKESAIILEEAVADGNITEYQKDNLIALMMLNRGYLINNILEKK